MIHFITIISYLRQGTSQSLQFGQLEELLNLDLHILRKLFRVATIVLMLMFIFIPTMRPINKIPIMLRYKSPWRINFQSSLRRPSISIFTNITPNLSIMLKLPIPILNGSNRWPSLQYLSSYSFIIFFNILITFFLFNSEMTFPKSASIITCISMFLYLIFRTSHYLCYPIY